jgi:hypothetical protein
VRCDTATLELLRVIEVGGEPDGLAAMPVLPRKPCPACSPVLKVTD